MEVPRACRATNGTVSAMALSCHSAIFVIEPPFDPTSMHIYVVWLASLVAASTVSVPSLVAGTAVCSKNELDTFAVANATVAPVCVAMLRDFGTCAEDCLAAFSSVVPAAPACLSATTANATVSASTTLLQEASAVVARCESARATFNASTAYAPKLASPDAPACTSTQETTWESRYGPEYLFGACSQEALTNRKCTTECRDKIEEGVANAPRCRQGDLLFGEAVKFHLVRCLTARQERFDTNAVLQAVVTAAGASNTSVDNVDEPQTAATTTNRTATATVTTAPPVATQASGGSRASMIPAVAVAIVGTVVLA